MGPDDAPLWAAWREASRRLRDDELHPFTIPGHKQRTDLPDGLGDLVAGDVPLYGGLAPRVRDADDLVRKAEARAAQRLGVDWCRYSVGGSTHGNQALALALGVPGDTVVVDRTSHRSVFLGLVLAGLRPVWVRPRLDDGTGLPLGLDASAVSEALARHPEARAVWVTSPSYVGTCSDVGALARVSHDAGVPLVVDAAWGAHLGSHPALPPHPLAAGADAVVTSLHKALPAMNQAALVAARTREAAGLLDRGRLDRAVDASATTSPSGAVLASADAALQVMADHGTELVSALLDRVERARHQLRHVPGLVLPDGGGRGEQRYDAAKLVVLLAGTGADGLAVEDDLVARGFTLEMAGRDLVVPMVTVADDDTSVDQLVAALTAAIERHRGEPRTIAALPAWTVEPDVVLSPREAFFAEREQVGWEQAIGRVSAELIAPYPPGVPVLAPGERIDDGALRSLRDARAAGSRIAYAADPTLDTVSVVAGP